MQVSIGSCHYGPGHAATMTGVHPTRTGWIAVCDEHRGRAEEAGYRLRTVATVPMTGPGAAAAPARPTDEDLGGAKRPAGDDGGESGAMGDMDVLDAMLDSA